MKKYYKVLFFLTVFFVKNSFGAQGAQVFKFSENSAFRNLNNQEKSLYTGVLLDFTLKEILNSEDSLLSHDKDLGYKIIQSDAILPDLERKKLSNCLIFFLEANKKRDALIKSEKNDRFKLHIEFLKRLQYCQD